MVPPTSCSACTHAGVLCQICGVAAPCSVTLYNSTGDAIIIPAAICFTCSLGPNKNEKQSSPTLTVSKLNHTELIIEEVKDDDTDITDDTNIAANAVTTINNTGINNNIAEIDAPHSNAVATPMCAPPSPPLIPVPPPVTHDHITDITDTTAIDASSVFHDGTGKNAVEMSVFTANTGHHTNGSAAVSDVQLRSDSTDGNGTVRIHVSPSIRVNANHIPVVLSSNENETITSVVSPTASIPSTATIIESGESSSSPVSSVTEHEDVEGQDSEDPISPARGALSSVLQQSVGVKLPGFLYQVRAIVLKNYHLMKGEYKGKVCCFAFYLLLLVVPFLLLSFVFVIL